MDTRSVDSILRQLTCDRYHDVTSWVVTESAGADGWRVACYRGKPGAFRRGQGFISARALMARANDERGVLDEFMSAIRCAYLGAGGGQPVVPFRIGTRSPKRLRIQAEATQ